MSRQHLKLMEVFRSKRRIQGLTHNFYKYPARFNPEFVRIVIQDTTEPGDWVLDPFMGGGTTVVEALALGRRAIGVDISGLAEFITQVKTTPLSERDLSEIRQWATMVGETMSRLAGDITPHVPSVRNLPDEVRPFFAVALWTADQLRFPRQRRFARCALLQVGQWALDCKARLPGSEALCNELVRRVDQMAEGLQEFVDACKRARVRKDKVTGLRYLLNCPASDSRLVELLRNKGIRPKLVLTSPPYPGVHILYHRWQVFGRRETPAPFWIAGLQDGHSASHYTMGSRTPLGLLNYFQTLHHTFGTLRSVLSPETLVVQLVAFSNTEAQLPLYRCTMARAGFAEISGGGRWVSGWVRLVPNRKWYAHVRRDSDASREVLLVHRPRPVDH